MTEKNSKTPRNEMKMTTNYRKELNRIQKDEKGISNIPSEFQIKFFKRGNYKTVGQFT